MPSFRTTARPEGLHTFRDNNRVSMNLAEGSKIGAYEIPSLIGADRMQEVYRAAGISFGKMDGSVLGQAAWNMSPYNLYTLHDAQPLQFRSSLCKAFIHTQFINPRLAGNQFTSRQITCSSLRPRVVQLALKTSF